MSNNTMYLEIGELLNCLKEDSKNSHKWLTPAQVGEELGIHINTVYRLLKQGELPVYNFGLDTEKVRYKVKRSDLQEYIERRKVEVVGVVGEVEAVGRGCSCM